MVNNMNKKFGHLISLNGESLYLLMDNEMYSPLRVNERITRKIQDALTTKTPPKNSCLRKLDTIWYQGQFMLAAEFNPEVKCAKGSIQLSNRNKTEICFKCLCNGHCKDAFMQNVVAKNILPTLYNTKQK